MTKRKIDPLAKGLNDNTSSSHACARARTCTELKGDSHTASSPLRPYTENEDENAKGFGSSIPANEPDERRVFIDPVGHQADESLEEHLMKKSRKC